MTEEELIQLVRQKGQRYLRLPNVTSVGVGHRVKGGQRTGELTVQFTVRRKLNPERLAMEGITPLPKTIVADDGTEVPVDVLQRSYRLSYEIVELPAITNFAPASLTNEQLRRSRLPTILPGISVGHTNAETGTFGAVVYDALNGTPYILSNWHVLHGLSGKLGDPITQPGAHDDPNVSSNVAGRLVRSHLGLAGDCAIASVIARGLDSRLLELNLVPRRIGKARTNDRVVKSGRTSGVTYGIVSRVGINVPTDYGGDVGIRDIGAFEIEPNPQKPASGGAISKEGDSGSVWLVDTNAADKDVVLGLHFASGIDPDSDGETALACNMHSVLQKLQVSLIKP
jgi:endonuclease G